MAVDTSASLRFEKEIKAYEASDEKSPPPTGAILFTGSSSIRRWTSLAADFPEHKVINRGFGGCQLSDVIYYADRIIIPYKPRLVIVGAGNNDINAGKTPQQVFDDFKTLVEKIREVARDADRLSIDQSQPETLGTGGKAARGQPSGKRVCGPRGELGLHRIVRCLSRLRWQASAGTVRGRWPAPDSRRLQGADANRAAPFAVSRPLRLLRSDSSPTRVVISCSFVG